jgi:hypothetical protein
MYRYGAPVELACGFLGLGFRNKKLLVATMDPLALLDLCLAAFRLLATRLTLSTLKTAHEALDLTGSVNNALLAGVKRVALVAEIDAQAWPGRPGFPGVATGTRNRCGLIIWVNALLHVTDSPDLAARLAMCPVQLMRWNY